MTQARLKEVLDYDPDTGIFVHKIDKARCVKAWSIAGYRNDQGYLRVMIDSKRHLLHHLAWLYVYGRWPRPEIDHINGIRDDNRIANLRQATRSQNQANRKAIMNRLKGAYKHEGMWISTITSKGHRTYLGRFQTEREAHNAYCWAAKCLFGKYARTS